MSVMAASLGKRIENPKRLLFYAHKDDADGKRLLAVIAGAIPGGNLEIYRNLTDLARGLRSPGSGQVIAVLMASRRDELKQFFLLQDLLANVPLILVVPGRDEETIQQAHQMMPRFLSQKDSDFANLSQVLEKMFQAGG
jgi:hypothetical protein